MENEIEIIEKDFNDIEKINSTNDTEANKLIQPVQSFEDLNPYRR